MIRAMARDNKGQELVEYALTLPILLLLVLGIMEFGVAIFAYNTVANAAREGARVGAVVRVGSDVTLAEDEVKSAVVQRSGGLRLDPDQVAVEGLEESERVTVTVTYDHPMITGAILQAAGGNATLHLRSEAAMYRES